MAALSISRAWEETKAVLRRDGKLYATVALALFVLPGVLAQLVTPEAPQGEVPAPSLWLLLTALAFFVSLIGQLAVCRLALGPQISVGEAIRHGARRAPAYIAAAFLWLLPFLIVLGVLGTRIDPDPAKMSPGVALGILVVIPILIFFAVRFLLGSPVASAEHQSPVGILRRSWELTRGHWWRLFGFLTLLLIVLAVLLIAVETVVGSIVSLFGELEPLSVGALILSLASETVAAGGAVLLMVMLSRIYVQLAGATASVPHAP